MTTDLNVEFAFGGDAQLTGLQGMAVISAATRHVFAVRESFNPVIRKVAIVAIVMRFAL